MAGAGLEGTGLAGIEVGHPEIEGRTTDAAATGGRTPSERMWKRK
jgi:hypothetical protein